MAANNVLASKTGRVVYKQLPQKGDPGEAGADGPFVYPAGIYVIGASTTYTRTALSVPCVLFENEYYILNVTGTVGSELNPKDNYSQLGNRATWKRMEKFQYAFFEVLMGNFAKLASAVFWGSYMFSQHGADAKGNPVTGEDGYKDFTPDMSEFTPNVLINFLTGYAHFAGKKVVFKENGDVEITGNLKSGSIGSFFIDKGLSNTKGEDIIDDKAFIHMVGKNCRFDLNSLGTVGLCDISANGGSSTQEAVALFLQTYGSYSKALRIRCNAGGHSSSYAIESYGNVLLEARSSEKITAKRFHAKGFNVATKAYTSSGTVPDDIDFIRTYADGTHTLTLPTPGSCTGKMYYLKNTNGTWILHNGPFIPGNSWKQQDTYTVSDTLALQLISDGGNWCVFNCW